MNFPIIVKIDFNIFRITKLSEDNYDIHLFRYGDWMYNDNIGESSVKWYIDNSEEKYVSP